MDLGVDFDFIALWLIGDRLPRPSSAILRNFIFYSADVDDLIGSSLPLTFFNSAVDFRWLSLLDNKICVELEIG